MRRKRSEHATGPNTEHAPRDAADTNAPTAIPILPRITEECVPGSSDKRPCPRCRETGTCLECNGTGQIGCLTCEGRGNRTTPRGLSFSCKACKGTGIVACSPVCSSCGGSGVITEAMQRDVREKYQIRFVEYQALVNVSTYLLLANVAVYVIGTATPWGANVVRQMCSTPYIVANGEYWRFLTPIFVHANIPHLLFNSLFMIQFCPPLEGIYGSGVFLGLYLWSGLCGEILSWWMHQGIGGIGASGALFGVGMAYLGLHRRFGMFDSTSINRWTTYLVAFLVLGFGSSALGMNFLNLDNWAHLGGAIGGLAFVWLWPRPSGH